MTDFRTLHEDGILKDILDYVTQKNPENNRVGSIIDGVTGFVKGTKNQNKSIISSNLAKSSRALTAVFPVIVSKSVDIEKAVMISKAVERKCVGMLQMLFAANNITGAKSASEYLKNFHGNISSSLDLSSMDIDDFLQYTEGLDEGSSIVYKEAIDAINEDVRNNIHYTLESGVVNPPINNMRKNGYVIHELSLGPEDGRDTETIRVATRSTPVRDRVSNRILPGEFDTETITTTDTTKVPFAMNDYRYATDVLKGQVLDSDIRKANEAQPSLMIINFISTVNENTPIQSSCVIGVKAVLHYVDPQDIVNRVILKKSDSRGLFNLIRATTREISFFKDFLFAIDRAKVDAVAKSGRGSTDKIWKLLELRADRLKGAKVTRQSQASCAAITTLVISKAEVDYIKQFHRIDLSKAGTLKGILRGYNMMAAAIIDEVTERVDFLWDDGSNVFESLSFMSLEREDNGSMYKKVVNLVSRGR